MAVVECRRGSAALARGRRALYYLAPDGTMMVVDILSPPPALKASAVRAMAEELLVVESLDAGAIKAVIAGAA